MAAPITFPLAGANLNPLGVVEFQDAHTFNTSQFGILGTHNAGAGTKEYSAQILQCLACSLSRRNPNNSEELDLVYYAVHGFDLPAILGSLETAVNAGFIHGVNQAGTPMEIGFSICRSAQIWAQKNSL